MLDYARLQTAMLLRRLAYQVGRASKNAGPEAIHDLRVAIRRLNRCLRTFAPFYPEPARKKIRRRLSELMAAAADVRDRDIAASLLRQAGMPAEAAVYRTLAEERERAAAQLAAVLHQWRRHSASRKWREDLGL